MTTARRGSCLCGEIRFEIDGKFGPAGQCHCSKCRKVSGTDGNAVFYASAAGFHWLAGEDLIERVAVPAGKGWRSHFCRRCGSPAPLSAANGKFFFVPAGLLADDPGFPNGRASVGERVCQYVENSGGTVALQKNE